MKKYKILNTYTKIAALFVVFFVLFALFVPVVGSFAVADSVPAIEQTNVLDDLMGSTLGGVPFDLLKYPFTKEGALQIVSLVEFGYSTRDLSDYGLYVYIYNPLGLEIDVKSGQNKVQMAVAYKDDSAVEWEKFGLRFVNMSEGDYKGLFYKFKVTDHVASNGSTFAGRVNSLARRYDVSGIELLTVGDVNATEYGVGGTYTYTGFAKGYGPDESADSTLDCTVKGFETVTLECHQTNYRTNVSSLGANHYNEVSTVYFAVPERLWKDYGGLQRIAAEWWEYKTRPILVTCDQDLYRSFLPYTQQYGVTSLEVGNRFVFADSSYLAMTGEIIMGYAYNAPAAREQWGLLPYAFYAPEEDSTIGGVFDFLTSKSKTGAVEGDVVKDWIYSYNNDLGNGYIDCNGRAISADLFEDGVDEGRTRGYNRKSVDLGDTFDLMSYDSNHNWWDKLVDFGFSVPQTGGDYADVSPIYELTAKDLVGSDDVVSKRLLVNSEDVDELRLFYAAQELLGNRVVLFRFANTDYFSAAAGSGTVKGGLFGNSLDVDVTERSGTAYIAQETVFFDFDVISLTFNKDGAFLVIPVVASPTDVVSGVTPPADSFDWWKILAAILMLILLIVILWPIMPYIVRAVIWIITLPFKAIRALVRAVKRNKEK